MRSVSLFTSLLLTCLLGICFSFVLVRPVHAQDVGIGAPDCSLSSGSYSCTTDQLPQGVSCVWNSFDSQYSCYDSGGMSGIDCSIGSQDSLNCSASAASPSTGSSGSGGSASDGGYVPNPSLQSTGTGWLDKITDWIAGAVHTVFKALVDLLRDVIVWLFEAVLSLFAAMISAIKPPSFLSNYSMGSILGRSGSIAEFFMAQLQIPAALGLIAAGYAFRLLRKFLTLFQW